MEKLTNEEIIKLLYHAEEIYIDAITKNDYYQPGLCIVLKSAIFNKHYEKISYSFHSINEIRIQDFIPIFGREFLKDLEPSHIHSFWWNTENTKVRLKAIRLMINNYEKQ